MDNGQWRQDGAPEESQEGPSVDHFLTLGAGPADEPLALRGEEDYERVARLECQAFIAEIRSSCGMEPDDTLLAVRTIDGVVVVVCYYNGTQSSGRYARRVLHRKPTRWSHTGRGYLELFETRNEQAAREMGVEARHMRYAYGDTRTEG